MVAGVGRGQHRGQKSAGNAERRERDGVLPDREPGRKRRNREQQRECRSRRDQGVET
jgi:hypothetical protein